MTIAHAQQIIGNALDEGIQDAYDECSEDEVNVALREIAQRILRNSGGDAN